MRQSRPLLKYWHANHSAPHRFLEHGLTIAPFLRYDLEGKLVGKSEERVAEMESLYKTFGKRAILLGWHEIRQLLFDYLPSGVVEFDKQVRPHCLIWQNSVATCFSNECFCYTELPCLLFDKQVLPCWM